jgi:energy-coupling factor transporter ATP-binding protein EcfA2
MKIIALKGKNGSGKSTVAAMLAKKLDEKGVSNKVLSFAEPLKKIVNYIYDDVIDFENRKEKENNRNLLETTADAIRSSFSFNPFVYQVCRQLDYCYAYDIEICIVSDLRFESESDGIYSWLETDDLTIVEITNPLTDNNPSEYDLDLIKADKTLIFGKDIEVQIDELLNSIL